MARPTRLDTPEFVQNFTDLVRQGMTITATCEALGLHDSTWRRWRAQAEADLDAGDTDTKHALFLTAVQESRRQAERHAIAGVLRAGMGERTVTVDTTTKTYQKAVGRGDDARLVEVTETTERRTERTEKAWQALAWWLERSYPDRYARVTRQWVSGPDEGPVEVVNPDELRARLDADLEAFASTLDDDLAAGLGAPADLEGLS